MNRSKEETPLSASKFGLPVFKDFKDAYFEIAKYIHEHGEKVFAGNSTERELVHSGFTIQDVDNVISVERGLQVRYAVAELIWYWSGSNDTEWISTFSSFWKHITDDGKHSNSAYGYMIHNKWNFDQVDMIIKSLSDDQYSRRATIKINVPRNPEQEVFDLVETHDEWCTLSLQFLIRDNKLDMITNMRSNDIWFGLPYDIIYFTYIQKYICHQLLGIYPDLKLGTYTHFVGSIHEYERNRDDIQKQLVDKEGPDEPDFNINFNPDIKNQAKQDYIFIQNMINENLDKTEIHRIFDNQILPKYINMK